GLSRHENAKHNDYNTPPIQHYMLPENAINEWKKMLVHAIHKRLPLAFRKTGKQVSYVVLLIQTTAENSVPALDAILAKKVAKKKKKQGNIDKEESSSAITLEKDKALWPEFIVDWVQETIKDFSRHQITSG
ncbi:16401_t:CDS:2, partial [Dentiscutata heterogama]